MLICSALPQPCGNSPLEDFRSTLQDWKTAGGIHHIWRRRWLPWTWSKSHLRLVITSATAAIIRISVFRFFGSVVSVGSNPADGWLVWERSHRHRPGPVSDPFRPTPTRPKRLPPQTVRAEVSLLLPSNWQMILDNEVDCRTREFGSTGRPLDRSALSENRIFQKPRPLPMEACRLPRLLLVNRPSRKGEGAFS